MLHGLPGLIIIPFFAGFFTQFIKLVIHIVRGDFTWKLLDRYGGMPSAHAAFVVSLTTVLGVHEGLHSPVFALAAVFSFLIIRDAMGLRQFLGWHARVLNMLIKELPTREEQKFPEHIEEHLGHTPLQVFIGGMLGLILAGGLYPLFY